MKETPSCQLLFISGTDTGVGKTLLTALLLRHLRRRNVSALAIKPFCSGSRADAQLLHALQGGDLTLNEINPFYFRQPLAPLVAARKQERFVELNEVVGHIRLIAGRLAQSKSPRSILLIEGAGGLLVPLGRDYFTLDLIRELRCGVIVVSCNRLGTINHTLLSLQALHNACPYLVAKGASSPGMSGLSERASHRKSDTLRTHPIARATVVLMEPRRRDQSSGSNPEILGEFLGLTPICRIPYLGKECGSARAIERIVKKIEKSLAQILD